MGLRVGIVRDERFLEHKTGHIHPESPSRLRIMYRMLDRDFPEGLIRIEPELATLEHLELVHTPSYIEKVLKTADHTFTSLAPDTPASAKTYLAAWLGVGGCLKGLEALLEGQCDVCFLLIRPPGHHALADRAAGFCIFNNLGITARFAMKHYKLKRILIIDWDAHHGNGLHDLFYGEKEVLYLSTHDMWQYPYSGNWEETGKGEGEGYTINVPVPRTLEDKEILHLYQEVLGPVIRRYRPELVLVAAGSDAHHQDPIGRFRLTEKFFGALTHFLVQWTAEVDQPPLLFALEGGYDPRSSARCVKEILNALKSEGAPRHVLNGATQTATALVEKARRIHAKYGVWVDG
jgi:acetoin utilization deacetylase AcuC-like enzyme